MKLLHLELDIDIKNDNLDLDKDNEMINYDEEMALYVLYLN